MFRHVQHSVLQQNTNQKVHIVISKPPFHHGITGVFVLAVAEINYCCESF
jgi:16S rRNA G1207 methylase RsmC